MAAGSQKEVDIDLNTSQIREWRAIVTLIAFILTNINVLFPFHIPIYVPRKLVEGFFSSLSTLRIIPATRKQNTQQQKTEKNASRQENEHGSETNTTDRSSSLFIKLNFPMNLVTAPLIADLFLLAISAIGRKEVHDGTLGNNGINPLDVMIFFITLAYIAISIDASGLIRFLAFKVLQWGGKVGHRLFLYLYIFFFALGSFVGNDPIILSGTAFLAYLTRVSSNIVHPRAWIHTQFVVANSCSAILVSSNPTNLVIAGAFNIKFIHYSANMVVPVVVTAIVLFPFLLYVVFADESLIPLSIKMHELPEEARNRKPVNPNIPHARGDSEEQENANDEQGQLLSLEEIMNPFLDKGGAAFGSVVMAATLITLLAINAASTSTGEHPVFWVTLPAAFIMFCWDLAFGWLHREETRDIARKGRRRAEESRLEQEKEKARQTELNPTTLENPPIGAPAVLVSDSDKYTSCPSSLGLEPSNPDVSKSSYTKASHLHSNGASAPDEKKGCQSKLAGGVLEMTSSQGSDLEDFIKEDQVPERHTLFSLTTQAYRWMQETFPTVMSVLEHLPFALVPFAFSMFVLVQGLVGTGWVPVIAKGWDHWVEKTGTMGAISGMGLISVLFCNISGTNIGASLLLSRVIQAWEKIHSQPGQSPISERTFWATIYSLCLGVNYGAFSIAFSASLAGLLWRDILARKHIRVRSLEFMKVNLPIIAMSMAIACIVLTGQVYITRDTSPYRIAGRQ